VDGKRVPDATLPFPFSGNVSRAPSAADIFLPFTAGRAVLHNEAMCRFIAAMLWLIFSTAAFAQQNAPPAAAATMSLTIYSSARFDEFDATGLMKGNLNQIPGLAIIQQRRAIELTEGESVVQLPDIARSADFSTLSLRPAAADSFKVLSQSFTDSATDPDSLLHRAVGHEVIINRKAPPLSDRPRTPETINAKLLAFDQNQIVLETANRQLPIQIIPRNAEISEIKLMADSGLIFNQAPFTARLSAAKAGAQEAIVTYHAAGMTWHADYGILLRDESKAGFSAAITILNRSGSAFDSARVNLVAASPGLNLNTASRRTAEEVGKQVYSLPQPVSIPADAAHRVSLAEGNISSQTVLACTPADYARVPLLASTYLAIENNSKNGLGLSLPPGRLRVTKQTDANAAPLLIADNVISGAAPDELILIRLGPPSQLSITREFKEHADTDRSATLQIAQLTIHNPTDRAKKIILVEPRPAAASQILEKTDEFQMQSQGLVFRTEVPANAEKVISYTLRKPAQ